MPYPKKTHCPSGHPYSVENVETTPSNPYARYCGPCRDVRAARRSALHAKKLASLWASLERSARAFVSPAGLDEIEQRRWRRAVEQVAASCAAKAKAWKGRQAA